jgi:hypothetical protein
VLGTARGSRAGDGGLASGFLHLPDLTLQRLRSSASIRRFADM